jgi:RNA polymerase sigma-70 factor, ECF subfamily
VAGSPEDEAWVERIRRGETAAFEAVTRRYGPRLVQFAASLIGAADDAEDVVQDVLWGIWDSRLTFRPSVSLQAYLLGSVRNRALNVLARRKVRANYRDRVSLGDPAAPDPPTPAETLLANEEAQGRHRMLERAFAALTEKQRTAIQLRYSTGLPMADVAAALGVSISATERLVSRALKVLRSEVSLANKPH